MTGQKGCLAGRLLWALIFGAGFGTLWLIMVMIVGQLLIAQWRAGNGRIRRGTFPEELIITTDGRALVRGSFVRGEQAGYRRLDGAPVEKASDIRQADSLPAWHMRELPPVDNPYFFLNSLGGNDWDWRLRPFLDELHPDNVWYFVHDGRPYGAGYFAGYDKVEKRSIGFIGDKGFSAECPPREDWFAVERHLVRSTLMKLWTSVGVTKGPPGVQLDSLEKSPIPPHFVFVPSGKELKLVDLSKQTLRSVLMTPEPIEGIYVAAHLTLFDTLGVSPANSADSPPEKANRPIEPAPNQAVAPRSDDAAVGVTTAHQIYVLDRDLRQRNVFTIPEEARGELELYLRQGWVVALMSAETTSEHKLLRPQMLYKIAADGSIRDGKLVKTHMRDDPPWSERSDWLVLPAALPSPAILCFVEPLVIARMELSDGYLDGFSVMTRESGLLLVVLAMFVVSLAAITWGRGVAYSLPLGERLAWTAFVALFGLGGFVGFLLHRRWPLRAECPSCHAQTVLEHGSCARCGEEFPGPIFKGTEVFA